MGENNKLFIGLMSGTSMDGIDAAIIRLDQQHCQLIGSLEYNIPETLRQELLALCQPGNNEIDRLGIADRQLAEQFSVACQVLLAQCGIAASEITAIGSHGQTIRHRPEASSPFTLQIGDPNTIAQRTGITTVADFRRRDIAVGGQGAPLAPAFHQHVFSSSQYNRVIINIGGMANMTFLGSDGHIEGFDTGPGNVLMDSWIQQCRSEKYDRDGQWAASGTINPPLLEQLLEHGYFSQTAPKSTGREDFNLDWLVGHIHQHEIKPEDVQATLLELTALSIFQEIERLSANVDEIYICGGGAYNRQLMLRLESLASPRLLANTSELGIAAEWVEAAAFAWLAKKTLERGKINTSPITGAKSNVILGGIYPG